jgi:2-succinyl-6-hydroxy-2,4-cyclohexadiene-1-carboxylate synthase
MRLNYHTLGNVKQDAIVFLHGFLGRSDDWQDVAEQFESDYYCVMPDLPGHGDTPLSDCQEDYTIESAGKSIIELLDDLEIERAVLVGYSMGGRIALHTALEYQDRFGALVVESAGPGLRTGQERSERIAVDEKNIEKLDRLGMKRFIDYWYNVPLFESLQNHPDKLALLKEKRVTNSKEGLILSLRGTGKGRQPSLWSRLQELHLPVLLVCGELDSKFVGTSTEMSGKMQSAQLNAVPGAGHNVHLEQPGKFAQAVGDFIREYKSEYQEIENHVEH